MYLDLATKNLQKFTDKAMIMALMGTTKVDRDEPSKRIKQRRSRIIQGEITATSLTNDFYNHANYRVLLVNYRPPARTRTFSIKENKITYAVFV